MATLATDFSYYPEPITCRTGQIDISTLPDLHESVSGIEQHPHIDNGWLFVLPEQVHYSNGGGSRLFGLPKTHTIRHQSADGADHLAFHVWMLSFFSGMRLTTAERGFVDATPIRPHKLVDFVLSGGFDKAIGLAESFWQTNRHRPQTVTRIIAAIHALFLAQNPRFFEFEEFIYLYTALDACYRLLADLRGLKNDVSHAQRINWMCTELGISPPVWATAPPGTRSLIADLRNATFHEALFNGEPLGFALLDAGVGENLMLDVAALLCRLLVALLGAASVDYVRSPTDTRQLHGLDL